ncbi:hypothetical protein BKI52_20325 [marine bacterium AO1-C]|nr:hypothetical protein BKI52_20325 [marine bacterium AO1-C]
MAKSLAQQLIEKNLKTKDPYLDLGYCGLDGTEPELKLLSKCDHLETLVFSNQWYEYEKESLDWVGKESQNKGEKNALAQVPHSVPRTLKKLILGGSGNWKINDFGFLKEFQQLQVLNLRLNFIKNLSFLQNLTQLQSLALSGNQITDIQALQKLTQLQSLDLSINQIADISVLYNLTQLQSLHLKSNKVSDVGVLQSLSQLQDLHLGYNQVSDISALQKLVQLQFLNLRSNLVSDISFIQNLSQLTYINLGKNQIENLSSDFFSHLPNIRTLYLYSNPIQNIPQEVFNKRYGDVSKEVKDYLGSTQKVADRRTLNEAKLVIGGVGNVGKSELTDALSVPNYQFVSGRESTTGIRIKEWDFNIQKEGSKTNFRANIWDLAGQKENYNTHQFFLSKNTLYLFVWEARKGIEQANQFDYWLEIITLLSEKAPILVVQNKVDSHQGEISQKDWKAKFPNIIDFYKTSCATGQGIEALRKAIQKELLQLPNAQSIWNKYRFKVREVLENHSEEYIDIEEYLKICRKNHVTREQAMFLSQQLHDLGVILHFSEDALLKNTLVLKSDWAIDAAYCLVDTQKVQNGRFSKQDLDTIWNDPRFEFKQAFLLELMKKFELIFQFQGSDIYIVPETLPIEEHFSLNVPANTSLHFEYHYDFMPKGILSRFVCRIHHYIKDDWFWRFGVVLQHEQDTQAEITANEVDKKITLKLWGSQSDTLLAIIRAEINYIHETLKNPTLQEVIPCYCDNCKTKQTDYFEYDYLKMCLEEGDTDLRCRNRTKVSIKKLLEGIIDPHEAHIDEFIELIDENRFDDFYAKADHLNLSGFELNKIRMEFIDNGADSRLAQRLKTWVRTHFNARK